MLRSARVILSSQSVGGEWEASLTVLHALETLMQSHELKFELHLAAATPVLETPGVRQCMRARPILRPSPLSSSTSLAIAVAARRSSDVH